MQDSTYKIIKVTEENNVVTITYLCNREPLPHSLFQCSFAVDENQYVIYEILQYSLISEDFLDIRGLYSTQLEQAIAQTLCEHMSDQSYIHQFSS
jgi:hypothetical protein